MNEAGYKEVAAAYPESNLHGELTLAGAIRKYWDVISKNWIAERTLNENAADYEKRILFATPLKPLKDYSQNDLNDIVEGLAAENDYEEGTREHYEHLIRLVIDACFDGGEQIHGSLVKSRIERKTKERSPIVKSFTEEEENAFHEWASRLNGNEVKGPELAVVLMFYYAFRNQEAAGFCFGNYDQATNHNVPVLRVLQTTIGQTRRTKVRGKTLNAHREIPCTSKLVCRLIEERKKHVIEKSGKTSEEIMLWPICSSEKDLSEHCTTNEITVCAREVFEMLNIAGNRWDDVLEEAMGYDYEEIRNDTETPQAYALRRNAVTRFYSYPIQLDEAELHYIIGHEIDVTGIERSDYTNTDIMETVVNKMRRHRFYK